MYAETIFWTIRLRFVSSGQLLSSSRGGGNAEGGVGNVEDDGNVDGESGGGGGGGSDNEGELIEIDTAASAPKPTEYRDLFTYNVENIPETLTVRTLIRQFVRPREYGPLVSRSQLDVESLAPFIDAPDDLLVYMSVDVGAGIKYYIVDCERSILENLRNRVVVGRLAFIIATARDAFDFEAPSEEDLELLRLANKVSDGFQVCTLCVKKKNSLLHPANEIFYFRISRVFINEVAAAVIGRLTAGSAAARHIEAAVQCAAAAATIFDLINVAAVIHTILASATTIAAILAAAIHVDAAAAVTLIMIAQKCHGSNFSHLLFC